MIISESKFFLEFNSKFIFLPIDKVYFDYLPYFALGSVNLDVLDFVVFANESIFGYNLFSWETIQPITADLSEAFPDKLRDLHGYSYRLLINTEPTLLWKDGKIYGIAMSILEALTEKQNATFHISRNLGLEDPETYSFIDVALRTIYDFMPNTWIILQIGQQSPIQSYQEYAYCIMLTKGPKRSFLPYIVSPFDLATWILLLCSLLAGTLIFVASKDSYLKPAGSFLFSTFGHFFGQGSSLFENRSMKNASFQLFIFFIFLLGVVYESLIISFIFQNRSEQDIKSFEDLKKSDMPIYTDDYFIYISEQFGESEEFFERTQNGKLNDSFWWDVKERFAVIYDCDRIDYYYYQANNISKLFYRTNDRLYGYLHFYNTRKSNPFGKRIEEFITTIFESGIMEYYKWQFAVVSDTNYGRNAELLNLASENIFLGFEDLFEIYYILLIGYGVSVVAFVGEWMLFVVGGYFCGRK